MKTLAAIAGMSALFMVAALPAKGQTPAPLAQAAPPPAATEAPTPERLALARKVMAATGAARSMQTMFGSMATQMTASMAKNLPPAKREKVRVVAEAEDHALGRLAPQIIEEMTQAYATTFTDQELHDMLVFYDSPSGRSATAKAPEIARAMIRNIVKIVPQMRRDMAEEICSQSPCTAAEKSAYLGEAPATP